MLTCGPVPAAAWARDALAVMTAFGEDVALAEDRVASVTSASTPMALSEERVTRATVSR
jgi:hypothetical protein